MILNNIEMQQIRQALDEQSGLDAELLARSGDLLHLGKYDQAVHSAFVLLEERLRQMVRKEGLTGVVMAQNLFSKKGALTRLMGLNDWEREQYKNLYEAAFRLFRNPAAHTVTDYDAAKGKAIIGLVNLLLLLLGDPDQLPPPDLFPENVEEALALTERNVGAAAANRLRIFLGRCYQLGIDLRATKSTAWVPFKYGAVQKLENWPAPRLHPLTLFYIIADEKKPSLRVPLELYYTRVVGLNIEPLAQSLRQIGFRPMGKNRDYVLIFAEQHDKEFFGAFLDWLKQVVTQLSDLERASS